MRRLAHRKVRPVHNRHETIRLVLFVLQQFLQRQQHRPEYRHQRIRCRIPICREKHNHLPAASIALLNHPGKPIPQCHLDLLIQCGHFLQHFKVALFVLVIGNDQFEGRIDVELFGKQKAIEKFFVVTTRFVLQREIHTCADQIPQNIQCLTSIGRFVDVEFAFLWAISGDGREIAAERRMRLENGVMTMRGTTGRAADAAVPFVLVEVGHGGC